MKSVVFSIYLWIACGVVIISGREMYCEFAYSTAIQCKGLSLYDICLTDELKFYIKDNKNTTAERIANTTKLQISKSEVPLIPFQIFATIPNVVKIALNVVRVPVLSGKFFQKHEIYSRLLELEFSNNDMHTIHDDAFESMPNLETLSLDDNYLTIITARLFQSVPRLRSLGLDDNKIEAIEPNAFKNLHSLTRARFDDNKCVDEGLYYWSDKHISSLTETLQLCFNNWQLLKENPSAFTVESAQQTREMRTIQNQLRAISERTKIIEQSTKWRMFYMVSIVFVAIVGMTVFGLRHHIMAFVDGRGVAAPRIVPRYENDVHEILVR